MPRAQDGSFRGSKMTHVVELGNRMGGLTRNSPRTADCRLSAAIASGRCFIAYILAVGLVISTVEAQTKGQRPVILGLAHVAFRVSDMDKTRPFYESFLGYEEPFTLNDDSRIPTVAFVKVNDLQYIELFPAHAGNEGQLDHFALYTDNLTAMRRHLQSLGMYIFKDVHKGRTCNPFFTIRDPDGHFVEILQYSCNSLTAQSQGRFMPGERLSDHISHVGIVVNSVDASMKFYRDALGFREFGRGGGENAQPGWIGLRTPDGSDFIELIPVSGKPSPADLKRFNHIGLTISDVRKTAASLESRARNLPNGSIAVQTGGGLPARASFFDPDGTRIEIMEPLSTGVVQTERPSR